MIMRAERKPTTSNNKRKQATSKKGKICACVCVTNEEKLIELTQTIATGASTVSAIWKIGICVECFCVWEKTHSIKHTREWKIEMKGEWKLRYIHMFERAIAAAVADQHLCKINRIIFKNHLAEAMERYLSKHFPSSTMTCFRRIKWCMPYTACTQPNRTKKPSNRKHHKPKSIANEMKIIMIQRLTIPSHINAPIFRLDLRRKKEMPSRKPTTHSD